MKRHFPHKTNADFKEFSMAEMILFHLKTGPFGWLSNFAPYPITLDECEWPTVEHYYQASKYIDDPEWMETIRRNPRHYDAWRMGRCPDRPRRADWEDVKEDIMRSAVRAKLTQHAELRHRLLETRDHPSLTFRVEIDPRLATSKCMSARR